MNKVILAHVKDVQQLSSDVRSFSLAPIDQGILFEPGGHIDVLVPSGNEVERRSYSHVGLGADMTLQVAVRLTSTSRGGSRYMWSLKPGDTIKLEAAKNNFPLSFGAKRYELLAGGIGITPIIGMARALKKASKSFRLHYCVRNSEDAAFVSELRDELGERFVLHDDSAQGRFEAQSYVEGLERDTELYMCGPIPMMDAVKRAWIATGRNLIKLRFETFGSDAQVDDQAFIVEVVETGARVEVPSNMSMLEALRSNNQPIMWDCERGECGLCKVEVDSLEGELDHRDVFLDDKEREQGRAMCSCVSRVRNGTVKVRIDSISHGRSL